MKGTTEMAKKKTRRKKATRKTRKGQWWGPGAGLMAAAKKAARKAKKGRRRGPSRGTLGRINSGTPKSHKPLKVLEKRLSRLTKIVAARKKNPKKWA